MELVDTHCHLDIENHFPDFDEVLDRARRVDVTHMVLAGVYRKRWPRLMEICRRDSRLHAAPGLHPLYLDFHAEDDLDQLQGLVDTGEVVAIGEVGLDYHIGLERKGEQQSLFEEQVRIAGKAELPLLLHVRKAHDQVLSTLRKNRFGRGGVVHAFSGSLQQAEHYIRHGFKIGIGGTITYDRAKKIRRVAAELPLSTLVLETDSPDIPPMRHHGERNLPEYLPEILESLVKIRSEDESTIAHRTTQNALQVLGLENW